MSRTQPLRLVLALIAVLLLAGPIGAAEMSLAETTTWQIDVARTVDFLTARDHDALPQLARQSAEIAQRTQSNGQALAAAKDRLDDQEARLNGVEKGVDGIGLRVDEMRERQEQDGATLQRQGSRIEDNSIKLYQTLQEADSLQDTVTGLREQLESMTAQDSASVSGEQRLPGSNRDQQLRLLVSVGLALLLPVGFILHEGGTRTAAKPDSAVASAAPMAAGPRVVVAWLIGTLSYCLLGFGIMFGGTHSGWIGSPFHFLEDLLRTTPMPDQADVLPPLLGQLAAVGTLAVVVSGAAGRWLSPVGHAAVAALAGALIHPLVGHWGQADRVLSDNQGWLQSAGFTDPGGAAGVGLLAAATALSLAIGLKPRRHKPVGDESGPWAAGAALFLWLGWLGLLMSAGTIDTSAQRLLLSTYLAAMGAVLAVLVFGSLFDADGKWPRHLGMGVLAALVAASGTYVRASPVEMLLVGMVAGTMYLPMRKLLLPHLGGGSGAVSALAAGGLWGPIAVVLFGPEGFLQVPVFDPLLAQFKGMLATIVLGAAAGRGLAILVRQGNLLLISATPVGGGKSP